MQECPNAHDRCTEFRAACCGCSGRRVLRPRIAARQRRQARPDADRPADPDGRAAAGRRRCGARAYEGALVGSVRGTGSGRQRRGAHGWVSRQPVQEDRPEAWQSGRHVHSEGTARRDHGDARAARVAERLAAGHAQMEGRPGRGNEAGRGNSCPDRFRSRLRRLRRRRARARLGRLQRAGRQGQDARDAGQRSPGARPLESDGARPENVRRPRHDLLRALDVQVRDCVREGSRRRFHHPRDGPRGLSVRGGPRELDRRTVRPRSPGQEHEPRAHSGMGQPRAGHESAEDGRAGFPDAEAKGGVAGFRASPARSHGVDDAQEQAADDQLAERGRKTGGARSETERRSTSFTRPTGIILGQASR